MQIKPNLDLTIFYPASISWLNWFSDIEESTDRPLRLWRANRGLELMRYWKREPSSCSCTFEFIFWNYSDWLLQLESWSCSCTFEFIFWIYSDWLLNNKLLLKVNRDWSLFGCKWVLVCMHDSQKMLTNIFSNSKSYLPSEKCATYLRGVKNR